MAASAAGAVDFAKEVYPVLQRACFECHGPEHQKGDLRLDTRAALQHEKAIVPGKPGESDLIRRVSLPQGHKEAMPKRGARLRSEEVANLKAWITEGAVWPEQITTARHWSYVKPVRPALPKVQATAWAKNDIDRFTLARMEAAGLAPAPAASPAVLIRRLSLDLTGLPPTVAEVKAFEEACRAGKPSTATPATVSDAAYEALVDRLLASQEFGVRWARPWLDLARYADSHGFQRDDLRSIWGYRDWVVKALNADLPFDQFTIDQVAGDLLPNATADQIVATGFHRCTPTNVEAGTDPEESRINQVIDRVNTTGAVWLGTTLECCQCHNHKYDPFSQTDYYRLLAYFNNTEQEADRTNPKVPGSIQFKGLAYTLSDPSQDAERIKLTAQLEALKPQMEAREKALVKVPVQAKEGSKQQVLRPAAFSTEAGNEHDLRPDGAVLITGEAADKDSYTFEADLAPGTINAVMIEALTDDSLPGDGPGRGDASRPNFVLQKFEVTRTTADGKATPLKFADAQASFVQKGFDPRSLIGTAEGRGWAIMPQFHKSHWAAFIFEEPLACAAGDKLTLRLEQNYGGGRVIGCLRVSTLSGDVQSLLPARVVDEPVPVVAAAVPKGKKGKKTAAAAAATTPAPHFSSDPQLAKLQRQRLALQRSLDALKPASTEVMKEMAEPRMTAIFKRGEYTSPGTAVTAGTPEIIEARAPEGSDRLALARWLVSKDNPLTARVTVNRWWAEIFGQGIVTTVEDFGIKGEPPTHPELLDWLAMEFMDHGWGMKHMLKQMVMSATYRQSADATRPPTLYAAGPRFRMDAEMIRDNALAIAGLLNLKQGGEPIRPPQPDGLWKKVGGQDYKYVVSPGDESYRRGLYVVLKRGSPYPSFVNFDSSARMACVLKRSRSNTPLQALTLLNDPVYVEATQAFAARVIKEAPASGGLEARLEQAFRMAVARAPKPQELAVLKRLWQAQFEATKDESAAWYAVASALLNLDECITK